MLGAVPLRRDVILDAVDSPAIVAGIFVDNSVKLLNGHEEASSRFGTVQWNAEEASKVNEGRYQPRTASSSSFGSDATLWPRIASPRPAEISASIFGSL